MFASLHTASYATRRMQWAGGNLRPVARLIDAIELRVQRNRLARLDDRMLADIGISRTTATAESKRSMWDATGLR